MDQRALAVFAYAVATFEGQPGNRNWRNNNPGNLKFAHQRGAISEDAQHFAIFNTIKDGFEALETQILLDATRNPTWTVTDFVNSYAPPRDGNPNNARYAQEISSCFGLPASARLKTILGVV
jgi:hypothetical protein